MKSTADLLKKALSQEEMPYWTKKLGLARQTLKFSRLEVLELREQVRLLEAERGRYAVAANAPAFGKNAAKKESF